MMESLLLRDVVCFPTCSCLTGEVTLRAPPPDAGGWGREAALGRGVLDVDAPGSPGREGIWCHGDV